MDVKRYWSRFPGNFVKPDTGQYLKDLIPPGPQFTGGPREWYETLVAELLSTVSELQKVTFAKYGRAKRVSIDVFASPDVTCIFECSVLLRLPKEEIPASDGKSRLVGTISDMSIWEDKLMSNDDVRIVATFDVDDGVDKTMYGNVTILDMPENGRKA
jgi:hypothetical protein